MASAAMRTASRLREKRLKNFVIRGSGYRRLGGKLGGIESRIGAVARQQFGKIGRAHVCTPVTNAHLVCRLMLEKKIVPLKLVTNITSWNNQTQDTYKFPAPYTHTLITIAS